MLPRGFVRIRQYGLLSNRHRHEELKLCGQLLEDATPAKADSPETEKHPERAVAITPTRVCPKCGAVRLIVIGEFPPLALYTVALARSRVAVVDSS